MLVLAACSNETERPTLGDEPADLPVPAEETGVAEVDALLERLAAAPDRAFTASYEALRRFGGEPTQAQVVNDPPVSVLRVDDVYLRTGPEPRTCEVATGACEDEVREQRLSQSVLTSGFWAAAPAAAIRTAMARRVGEITLTQEDIAGQRADCVGIPVEGGTDVYCVTEAGVVGRVDTAATLITLTAFTPSADAALLEPPSG